MMRVPAGDELLESSLTPGVAVDDEGAAAIEPPA